MDDKILSQQGLDSLVSSGEVVFDKEGTDEEALAMLYDFSQGVKLAPAQIGEVDAQINRLCSVLSRTLAVYLNTEVTLGLQAASVTSYEQYVSNLPTPVVAATFHLSRHTPLAVWQIDAPVAHAVIDCMLGGTGQQVATPSREMTAAEVALTGRFCTEILETWSIGWEALEESALRVEEVITSVAKIEDIHSPNEQSYQGRIEATIGSVQGQMNIALPAAALHSLVQPAKDETEVGDSVDLTLLGEGAVPIRATFADRKMFLKEVSQLGEGAIIDLGHYLDDPFVVSVAGRAKFLAESGVQRGRLSVKLIATT